MTGLGDLGGQFRISGANNISRDGSAIVGFGTFGFGGPGQIHTPVRWSSSGLQAIAPANAVIRSYRPGEAYGASQNGSVVVGSVTRFEVTGSAFDSAFRWTEADGLVELPYDTSFIVPLQPRKAFDVSADGKIVVGVAVLPGFGGTRAFIWTPDEGTSGLGPISPNIDSGANGVSADGKVVVGWAEIGIHPVFGERQERAFRWSSATGMVELGALNPASSGSKAYDVSDDGNVIVGSSASDAFVWDPAHGMREISALLTNAGLDLTGWQLREARSVSADGRTVVGIGINPSGVQEAWIAELPTTHIYEPGVLGMLVAGLSLLTLSTRRSARRHGGSGALSQ